MKKLSTLLLLTLSAVSCNMTEAPRVKAEAMAQTLYAFRGVTMNQRPVLQGSMTTEFKVHEEDTLAVTAWGNMSLTASTGDGAFPDTDFLDVDENRWIFDYQHALDVNGLENFHGGLVQYSRFGLATRELFVGTDWDWNKFNSAVNLHWDIDEADGMYLDGSIAGKFEVDERTAGFWKATLGFATSNMADFLYADDSAGFSDVKLEVGATRPLNKNTTLNTVIAFSTVLADDDALDAADIDTTQVWLGVGVNWAF